MSFPPPLQRSTHNTTTERGYVHHFCLKTFIFIHVSIVGHFIYFPCYHFRSAGWLKSSHGNNSVQHHQSKTEPQESPSSSPTFTNCHPRPQELDRASQGSFSSMPDPVDPTTITKTFKTGRKAAAQANLASRSKTPNSKSRRKRSKGHNKNTEGIKMELNLLYDLL